MKLKHKIPLGQQEELVHHAHSGIQHLLVLVIHADFDHTDYTVQRSVQARRIPAKFVCNNNAKSTQLKEKENAVPTVKHEKITRNHNSAISY